VGAFAANAMFARQVLKDHGGDAGAAAIWRQGRAELIEGAAILAAALVVWVSRAAWADCLVAAAIAAPMLRSSWTIMLDSRGSLSGANRRRRRVG
jgi:divalent metal cation (Fe/Co/Zn/Cd) transporter